MSAPPMPSERRAAFVRSLYQLYAQLESDRPHQSSAARRTLALLRRGLGGERQEAEAYPFVFQHDPPIREEGRWLLVAGLFALHPRAEARRQPLGQAMRLLQDKRPSAGQRFTQLLSVDQVALEKHYLRQAVLLLRTGDIPLDYGRLLTDLVDMTSSPEAARRVRLRWARDFHRPERRPSQQPDRHPPAAAAEAATTEAETIPSISTQGQP